MNAAADVALCLHGNLAVTLVIPLIGGKKSKMQSQLSGMETLLLG